MEIRVEDYLSQSQMEDIAKKIFVDKIEKMIEHMIKENGIYHFIQDRIFSLIVDRYVEKLTPKYEQQVLDKCVSEINSYDNGDNSLNNHIKWKLEDVVKEIINEHKEEIKLSGKENVLKMCNADVLISLITDVAKKMNLKEMVIEFLNQK